MHVAEVRWGNIEVDDEGLVLINNLLSSWRSNGQILGREFSLFPLDGLYRSFLMVPKSDSLDATHDNKYVILSKSGFESAGYSVPTIGSICEEPDSADPCECTTHSYFILYTRFLESPLRCGDCFGPLPLYNVPNQRLPNGELHDQIKSWESDYQACDTLQMNCSTGERFGLREMSDFESSLSKRGREICEGIASVTGTPVYYYLHRYRGRSLTAEEKRKCPSCGGDWLLDETLHEKFDFKCDRCRLLSNIALTVLNGISRLAHRQNAQKGVRRESGKT